MPEDKAVEYARIFIKNMIRLHPGREPEELIWTLTDDMAKNVKDIIRKVATEMFLNNQL